MPLSGKSEKQFVKVTVTLPQAGTFGPGFIFIVFEVGEVLTSINKSPVTLSFLLYPSTENEVCVFSEEMSFKPV